MALTSNNVTVTPHWATLLRQIKQVCMTYVTQRYLWIGMAFFGLIMVPNMLVSMGPQHARRDGAPTMAFVIGMPMLAAVPFLVGLAKSQLAHSRARLTPQFLPAHLIVLAGILLSFLVMLPLFAAPIAGFEPLGLVALAMAIGVPALWGSHMRRFTPLLVSLAVFYSLLTSWGLDWWIVNSVQHVKIHAAIVAFGIVLASSWIWRMSRLREEMDDYQNAYQMLFARRTSTEAIEQRRIVANQVRRSSLLRGVGDWWHSRLGGYFGGGMLGLVRILTYGLQATPIEVSGLFFVAMMLCMGVFLTQFSVLAQQGGDTGIVMFLVQFGNILPGMMAGELLAQRRPRIANEILLPLTRDQLINALFAASIRNSIVLWLMMHVALGVVLAMAGRPFEFRTILALLLLSASSTLAVIGASLRVSPWPSRAKRIVVSMTAMMILLPPLFAWMVSKAAINSATLATIVFALTAIGIWAIRSARRAWLNLEFV